MSKDSGDVLFIHHLDITSPYQNTVAHYLASQVSETHSVHVICRQEPDRDTENSTLDDAVVHDINTGNIPFVSGLLFVLLSSFYSLVLSWRYQFDVVYAFQKTIVQGFVASRLTGSRFVVGLQSVPVRQTNDFQESVSMDKSIGERLSNAFSSVYASLLSTLLQRTSEIVCLTQGIRNLTETVYDVDMSDAHVIGMGVDIEAFRRNYHKSNDGSSGPFTVAYVGSVGVNRGIGHLLEAIKESEGEVRLVIAGSGSDKHMSKLKQKAEQLGVDDRVQWLGVVPHHEVPKLLQKSDVAVSPLRDIESFQVSFPAKILEYFAAGCLVIATDISAHRRLIEDEANGFLYNGTAVELADHIDEIRQSSSDYEHVRNTARATAEDYSWESIISKQKLVMFADHPESDSEVKTENLNKSKRLPDFP